MHGPDLSQIPTQFPIEDHTQFSYIMQESLEFFGISESKKDRYYLFDVKTNQIHVPDTYVRNFYFFRRNYYPQLSLVQMDSKEAVKLLERAVKYFSLYNFELAFNSNQSLFKAFINKVLEQSKTMFFRKLLDNTPFNQVKA